MDSTARLLLIGRGELENDVREGIERRGLSDRVFMLGVRDDIPALLSAMDVFIFPSVFEGLGIAGIEAQASGLPCVFSEGVPQEAVLSDGATRIGFDLGVERWAKTALSLAAGSIGCDRSLGCEMVASAGYDIEISAQKLWKIYSGLCTH